MTRMEVATRAFRAFNGRRLAWGSDDCIHLAAFPIKLCGYDPHEAMCEPYTNELGALKAMRKAGLESVDGWLDGLVGLPRVSVEAAEPGDILAIRAPGLILPALAVCMTSGLVLGFLEAGNWICQLTVPRMDAPGASFSAWRCEPGV